MGRAFLIGTVAGILATSFAFADSPSVTAVLSKSEAVVGEDVQLEIRLTGARGADAPEQIPVDGLEIHRTGTSQRVEINNFNLTASVSYDYTVVPWRAGMFTTPPQTIRLGSNSLRTPPLTLHVAASSNQQATQNRRGARPTTDTSKLVFAELIVPKKIAFVGEMVPVQVRLGYDPRTHPQLTEPPEITGQGFTAKKLQQSSENLETIKGRTYNLVTLDVKELPHSAPPSFSGAIGNFTMTTEAKPKSVQVGDPITVTSTISGRGNFDRVNAPVVEDEHGWHKYPPSSKFKQDDEVGISGAKSFETVLSPN